MNKAERLIALLWEQYKKDCPYAQATCERFGERNIVNDHIAFRSVNTGFDTGHGKGRQRGIDPIHAIWEYLGWRQAANYWIKDKNIEAIHLEPPQLGLPKIFISQFCTEKLRIETAGHGSESPQVTINSIMGQPREIISGQSGPNCGPEGWSAETLFEFFNMSLYPKVVTQEELSELDEISQYVAWVRLFGRKVNHFTLLVNALPKITEAGGPVTFRRSISYIWNDMGKSGIPMKDDIEGEGTELAQTSTKAALMEVPIRGENGIEYVEKPYAYYEIAQRGTVLFQGFKADQTKGLFDMTKEKA